ncbi:hypothetical protein [Kitasatospora griseola]|uniref:hypothetical protein n=1 Tax=Kitasatospora griseola TaxID=2064 RepID=UPI00382288BB
MTGRTERGGRLVAALRALLARLRPARPALSADPDPADWGDDPTGAWSPQPPTPMPWHYQDDGPGDDPDDATEFESECALDGAPYYGTGVYGRYCSWGCAAADGAGSDEDDAAT